MLRMDAVPAPPRLPAVAATCALLTLLPALSARPSKPDPIPPDRIADSYLIYSKLLPGNQIEWGNAPRSLWLVEDTTVAVPANEACASTEMMNPHESVKPPPARQAEFTDVLADYDAHCHDAYRLEASRFHLHLPVRLLDESGRKSFVNSVMHYLPPSNDIMRAPPTPAQFQGAAGMHSFTAVYFNRAHTLALTKIGMYCGGLCGNWRWVVLEKKNDVWQVLPWVSTYTIS